MLDWLSGRSLWGYGCRSSYELKAEYVYANGIVSRSDWSQSYRYSWKDRTEYYHTGFHGSVMMTSGESGLMAERCHYDAFGNNYAGSLAGHNTLGYGGKRYDPATGLYDYGFRDYDTRTGRFTTVDPVRDGTNWYAYCNNDPVNFFDLWGLCAVQDKAANNTNLANPNVLNGSADQLASNMEALVGTNYVWGGNSPADGGMDCSGSLIYGINQMGNNLPDQTVNDLYGLTVPVTGEPQRGDLRFLSNSNGVQVHVQTITNSNGTRVNATGGPENTITNPGVIELLTTELPSTGEIRRLQFNE